MALKNKKLSEYTDLASANIDATTKLVALTGTTKVNTNLPVTNFIEDTLTSTSVVKPLSANQGKVLQATKAPIANPAFTGVATIPSQASVAVVVAQGDTTPGNAIHISNDGDNIFSIDRISGDISVCPDKGIPTMWSPIINGLQTFADNTAAATLATGTVYKTSTGVLMIKY